MPVDHDSRGRGPTLARALKMLRRRRGLTAAQMAARLGIAPRTYEYFEAAEGDLNLDRLGAAAEALDADFYALFAAAEIGSAAFAVRCADNKLASFLVMALEEFDARVGDGISQLDPQTIRTAVQRAFRELEAIAAERMKLAGRWTGRRATES